MRIKFGARLTAPESRQERLYDSVGVVRSLHSAGHDSLANTPMIRRGERSGQIGIIRAYRAAHT